MPVLFFCATFSRKVRGVHRLNLKQRAGRKEAHLVPIALPEYARQDIPCWD